MPVVCAGATVSTSDHGKRRRSGFESTPTGGNAAGSVGTWASPAPPGLRESCRAASTPQRSTDHQGATASLARSQSARHGTRGKRWPGQHCSHQLASADLCSRKRPISVDAVTSARRTPPTIRCGPHAMRLRRWPRCRWHDDVKGCDEFGAEVTGELVTHGRLATDWGLVAGPALITASID